MTRITPGLFARTYDFNYDNGVTYGTVISSDGVQTKDFSEGRCVVLWCRESRGLQRTILSRPVPCLWMSPTEDALKFDPRRG